MLFTWRKKETIRPIRIANDVFFSRVRKMIRPIKSHRRVGLRQNSRHFRCLQFAVPPLYNLKFEGEKTERNVSLYFLSELSLSYMLLFIFKPVILLKILHFYLILYIQKKKVILLVIPGLLHILTLIIIFTKRFLISLLIYFVFFVISWCVVAYFGILK